MTTRIASAIAAIAITLSLGAIGAPSVSAAPVPPVPATDIYGSVTVCLTVPLGWFSISFCI